MMLSFLHILEAVTPFKKYLVCPIMNIHLIRSVEMDLSKAIVFAGKRLMVSESF